MSGTPEAWEEGPLSGEGPPQRIHGDEARTISAEYARTNHPTGQELPPLEPPQRTALEQAEYDGFVRGWDACAAWMGRLLQRAEEAADLWYRRATPGEIDRRLDAYFEAEAERFSRTGGLP